jgi:Secretion system C-terminal sorting domain
MTYELVTPYRDRGTPVDGFIMPSGITLNYLTGLLNWNMSESDFHSPGEYNFAVRAIQWTREDDIWYREQYVRIDFQVILDGDTPEDFFMDDNQLLDQYQRIAVAAAEAKTIKVFYEIDNQYQPKLELFSALPEDAVSFITYDSVSTSSGQDIKVGSLIISPGLDDIRTNGYVVTVRGSHVAGSGKVSSDLSYLVYTADELPPLPHPIVTATEDDLTKVQVYPNPAHDFLDIDVAGGGSSTVLIYSAQGTLLKSQRFESHATMDTRNLPAGVYICDVRRNNVSVRKIKIIKSK